MEPCQCPTCRIGRAMKSLADAHDEWIERSSEEEMDLHHLYDEAAAVAASRLPFPGRKRLRAAIRCMSFHEAVA